MDEKVDWSQLPIDLWPKIGKSLDNHIDVLRFRSVCESFRSSIPHSLPNSPSFPLQLTHPINNRVIPTFLNLATIYLIKPTHESSSTNLSSSSSKGWLIKVEESNNHPLRSLLGPISDRKLSYPLSNNASLMLLNLLNYRVIELCKSYSCRGRRTRWFSCKVRKVVFYPNSPWINVKDCVAFCIFQKGRIGFIKHGAKNWKLVDHKNCNYDDVIMFKGQFYVTDKCGTISRFDVCSLKLIQFSPPLCGFGNKKHLVESCGSLYVVDRYYESSDESSEDFGRDEVVECFKVYKLDEECGKWVDVKNLRDRTFILSNTCNFSVSAEELIGYQGNCIYFKDTFDVRMYNLEDHRIVTVDFHPSIDKSLWSNAPCVRM
ncbi:F-box family protein [Trifolium pratense]|uniref:F-box family protein n=1 Tax=Trifolium pratense TaxID=57577 RepID=A0A2K3PD56_TRIPR|nr:F-box family protein [Trifolium pratense]PNX72201.1 F-box family protein [Trifolium pratense]PNY13212.1 F-box family protein [Trifolium pratense]